MVYARRQKKRDAPKPRSRPAPRMYVVVHIASRARDSAPYSTVMLKEKSRVSPGAMTVTLRLCSNTSSSLVSVA